jgi:DNA-binding transcriptional LysR family regulator
MKSGVVFVQFLIRISFIDNENRKMRMTNLRNMDLNLLIVFDAIYLERSISKAAERLNLSQPAVSNALTRLRETIGDPLFKREGRGMAPTARAKSLREPIRQALDVLERGLRPNESFEYANSEREFVIAVEDYGETVVLPRFIDWLNSAAPGIKIRIRSESAMELSRELRDGTVDLAFDYFILRGSGFNNVCALTESLVTLARWDNPLVGEQLSMDNFLSLSHVVIEPRRKSMPMIDLALAKRGLERKISLVVPHFLSMPAVVRSSNLIGTLPRRIAYLYADQFKLRTYTVPVHTPEFPIYMIWHDSVDKDPGHQWLRNQLLTLCNAT